MDGAAGYVFFLGLVVWDGEGYVQGVANDVETGGVVSVFAGVGAVAGLRYLDLSDEC